MNLKEINTDKIAEELLRKHFSIEMIHPDKINYASTVSQHAFCRLAMITNNKNLFEESRERLTPYVNGKITNFMGSFKHFNIGGNATAFLAWLGEFDEVKPLLKEHCDKLIHGPRGPLKLLTGDQEGLYSHHHLSIDQYWIDKVFGSVPFLLFSGLIFDDEVYLDEVCSQIRAMDDLFKDAANGLYHQCFNFTPGKCSEDHWGRGNGWGIIALTEMVNYLPLNHPRRKETEKIFTDHLKACLKYQGDDGLWRQEITRLDSFVETSGSGFILYALGVALEKKLIEQKEMENLKRGLIGMRSYIGLDFSIHNTCCGCCHPGKGTISDYMAHGHPINDPHGFGPVSMAFSQAYNIGIKTL